MSHHTDNSAAQHPSAFPTEVLALSRCRRALSSYLFTVLRVRVALPLIHRSFSSGSSSLFGLLKPLQQQSLLIRLPCHLLLPWGDSLQQLIHGIYGHCHVSNGTKRQRRYSRTPRLLVSLYGAWLSRLLLHAILADLQAGSRRHILSKGYHWS
jgi:hypothetical protein